MIKKYFDEDEIDILNFIFEREFKPPFKMGDKNTRGDRTYFNNENNVLGILYYNHLLQISHKQSIRNVKHKICQVFDFPFDNWDWYDSIYPHLMSWMGNKLNVEIRTMALW